MKDRFVFVFCFLFLNTLRNSAEKIVKCRNFAIWCDIRSFEPIFPTEFHVSIVNIVMILIQLIYLPHQGTNQRFCRFVCRSSLIDFRKRLSRKIVFVVCLLPAFSNSSIKGCRLMYPVYSMSELVWSLKLLFVDLRSPVVLVPLFGSSVTELFLPYPMVYSS